MLKKFTSFVNIFCDDDMRYADNEMPCALGVCLGVLVLFSILLSLAQFIESL